MNANTSLQIDHEGRPVLTHQRGDGTVARCRPQTRDRCGLPDLMMFRHMMLEEPDNASVRLPYRPPMAVNPLNAENADRQGSELTLVATLAHDLELDHRTARNRPELRRYLSLPWTAPQERPAHRTDLLAPESGAVRLVKRLEDGVHVAETDTREPRGLADALQFHTQYEEPTTRASIHPWEGPGAVRIMDRASFQQENDEARRIGWVTDLEIGIALDRIWPIERHYLGLLHPGDEQ